MALDFIKDMTSGVLRGGVSQPWIVDEIIFVLMVLSSSALLLLTFKVTRVLRNRVPASRGSVDEDDGRGGVEEVSTR